MPNGMENGKKKKNRLRKKREKNPFSTAYLTLEPIPIEHVRSWEC